MKLVAALLVGAVLVGPAAAASVRPVSGTPLLSIDRKAVNRNFLPTRMLPGYTYASWSYRNGVLRLGFRNPAGSTIAWTVAPMNGSCDRGKQGSFQLAGNKVWFAQGEGVQRAWRCTFGMDGRAVRVTASSATSPSRLAGVGLGTVVASAKRY
jgi:hypothetical protein